MPGTGSGRGMAKTPGEDGSGRGLGAAGQAGEHPGGGDEAEAAGDEGGRPEARGAVEPRRLAAARLLDRKSTRLNSSHVRISYAVFCLKKKTLAANHPIAAHAPKSNGRRYIRSLRLGPSIRQTEVGLEPLAC